MVAPHAPLMALAASLCLLAVPSQGAGPAKPCDAYPNVAWWGNLTHKAVIDHVAAEHDNDWRLYLKKWDDQLATLEAVRERNSSAVIEARGIVLEGETLQAYIDKVRKRIAITRCLAAWTVPKR